MNQRDSLLNRPAIYSVYSHAFPDYWRFRRRFGANLFQNL